MTENMENPITIDHIKLTQAGTRKDGRVMVEMYANPLQYRVLELFEHQFGMLYQIGIDPNDLEPEQIVYTHFAAHWEERDKKKASGRNYRDVVRLEALRTSSEEKLYRILERMLSTLEGLQHLSLEIYTLLSQSHQGDIMPNPPPAAKQNRRPINPNTGAPATAETQPQPPPPPPPNSPPTHTIEFEDTPEGDPNQARKPIPAGTPVIATDKPAVSTRPQ